MELSQQSYMSGYGSVWRGISFFLFRASSKASFKRYTEYQLPYTDNTKIAEMGNRARERHNRFNPCEE